MTLTGRQLSALCIDYFDTLASHTSAAPRLGELLGMPAEFAHVWRVWGQRRMTERLPFEMLLEELFRSAGRRPPEDVIASVVDERRQRQARLLTEPDHRILDMLRACRALGVRVAVVSNAAVEDLEAWEGSPMAELVDATAFSWEVGATKPDQRIYEVALARLNASPASAAFVSDAPSDLDGARKAGFAAFWLATWFRPTVGTPDYPTIEHPADLPRLLQDANAT